MGIRSIYEILRIYAKRFEIEEHFKDIKWIEGYEWHQMKKLAIARTVFMFVFFGWWLLLKAYRTAAKHTNERKTHLKEQLSWFRTIWEYWPQASPETSLPDQLTLVLAP